MSSTLKAFYCDRFVLPLPAGHRFPMQKYAALRERVASFADVELEEPECASRAQLEAAHDPGYVARVMDGTLTASEVREIGFPWSSAMVERSRRSVGATIAAARQAIVDGVAVNLAGGTHHALSDRGGGFCVFNDVAVAIHAMRAEKLAFAPLVVDLDVHQGNGTASIFSSDAAVFTLSLHGEKNFPFRKEASDLDVGLPDGTSDEAYLDALKRALERALSAFTPDFVFFLAGADPHEGDRLGRLKLSFAGLEARDQAVYRMARELGVPIAVSMAGGYGRDPQATVEVHAQTVRCALQDRQMRAAHRPRPSA
jgi:acetoin utilization deacetylase AcuC-like enzyme